MALIRRLLNYRFTKVQLALLISFLNLVLFHYPFFRFVFEHIDYHSGSGMLMIISFVVLMLVVDAFVFLLLLLISLPVALGLVTLFFILNAISLYFVNTYGVIIDESMIGNVLNTKYQEASSFFSIKLILYVLLLGIVPCIFFFRAKMERMRLKKILFTSLAAILIMALFLGMNVKNSLWIDHNSKQLGGLAMPWCYSVNLCLFYVHKNQENQKEILLPNATIKDSVKSVVVLVIGESARKQNFSLYGYPKNTNPLLSATPNVYHFDAKSCATYTTAGVKCILEHSGSDDLYEILPNYLERNNVDVVWRTTNWGEPPVHIRQYQSREMFAPNCKGDACNYDELLLTGLKEQILASKKNKILIVLHTSTSHGPTYSKKYPPSFEVFKPVCNSVELGNCSRESLVNAYDNTIVYTDYILHTLIGDLQELKGFRSAMLFVSDHGESLGENNLYMHGVPMSFAPREQYEIPFIAWSSDTTVRYKTNVPVTQNHVFHSVLHFLAIESPVYNQELDIFK